ncbi:hypothetical protein CAP35_13025 [Chitinophagaceae bacterium IBVUCB1]|nr:hypothetical protein CAP35_13025 [Chitinophagaceae bacterium IBVUCB1]
MTEIRKASWYCKKLPRCLQALGFRINFMLYSKNLHCMKNLLLCLFAFISLPLYAQNTVEKFDIVPGVESSSPKSFTIYNGKLYFYARNERYQENIWSIEGNGQPVKAISLDTNNFASPGDMEKLMAVVDGKLYYSARAYGGFYNLYSYDGVQSKLISNFAGSGVFPIPQNLTALNNKLYFTIGGTGVQDLHMYNPANNTLSKLTAIIDSASGGGISNIIPYKGKLVVTMNASLSAGNRHMIWEYNPANNTLYTLHKESGLGSFGSNNEIDYYQIVNDTLFMAEGSSNYAPYNASGSAFFYYTGSGYVQVPPRIQCQYTGNGFRYINGAFFFGGIYKQDTTLCWQNLKAGIDMSVYDNNKQALGVCYWFNKYLETDIFLTYDNNGMGSYKLWALNGTNSPTLLSEEVNPYGNEAITYNGSMYYCGYDTTGGFEVYKYTNAKLSVQNTNNTKIATNIYPNPTNDYTTLNINLQQSQTLHISITDAQGRVVYSLPARQYAAQQHSVQLPVGQLAVGVYQYSIYSGAVLMASGKLVRE